MRVWVGAGIDRGSGLDKMFIENATKILDSSVVRGQLSVEPGYRPVSVVSCQLSVVCGQLSVVSCQLSVVSCQLSVVSCQLSVVSCQLPGGGEASGVMARWRRPPVASTAATRRVPETRAERGVVRCRGREGGEIQDRIAMRADWSRKVRIGGALLAT